MSTTYDEPVTWHGVDPEGLLAAAVLLAGVAESRQAAETGDHHLGRRRGRRGRAAGPSRARRRARHRVGVGVMHVLLGVPVLGVEAAVAVVAFGCARWGRPPTVVASGLSIPAAAGLAAALVASDAYGYFRQLGTFRELVAVADRIGGSTLLVGAAAVGVLVLAVPWLAGLALRATARARTSEVGQEAAEVDAALAQREAAQAQEIAALREDQARLARDVHDVVGHSLAVILAQAESAQYLPDDPAHLKTTLATIATSARTSLQDVRHVLSVEAAPPARDPAAWSSWSRASAPAARRWWSTRSARRSRCRPSSRWSRTGCCRRCSPTPSSTACASTRSPSSGTGRAG